MTMVENGIDRLTDISENCDKEHLAGIWQVLQIHFISEHFDSKAAILLFTNIACQHRFFMLLVRCLES